MVPDPGFNNEEINTARLSLSKAYTYGDKFSISDGTVKSTPLGIWKNV